jgi:cytochrome c oxidase subunit 1/cytochrome c oxidase subunit I+III
VTAEFLRRNDHRRIGVLYMISALVFFLIGGAEAMVMRAQLALPDLKLLAPGAYNQIFTMHGTTMIFLVVTPVLTGFGIYLVPPMIGAEDMAFPRLSAVAFWLQAGGGLLLYAGFAAGNAPDAGWFSYAPLSERPFSPGPGLDLWAAALLLIGCGSIGSAINLVVTIVTARTAGITMRRAPLFVWMNLVNSVMILFALPVLAASLVMLLADRLLHARFFDSAQGGSPLLWQHYFWIFGHPEVYIMILPAFGMISEIIPVFSRRPIFGYPFMAASTLAIAFLSYGVWVHHMFAVALGRTLLSVFAAASMLIAVPTGVKIFSWTATMFGGSVRLTTSMLFAVAFLLEFTIGGLSGVAFAAVPVDWQMTDTYFVVAHIHYVLFGGTIFAIFAGTYYWFPKMTGHLLDEAIGRWHFWLVVVGFNMTFFVQHFLGILGMPRRVYTYAGFPGWGALNLISTIGAGILTLGVLIFVANVLVSLRFGAVAGANPWDAWTLEWTDDPLTAKVRSRRPAKPGMALLLLAEAVFFFMLMLAFVYFREESLKTAAAALRLRTASVYTACLLASGFALRRAEASAGPRARRWLGLTILLGVIFVAGQGSEHARLIRNGFTVSHDLFGTTFFTLTGMHGIHVLTGLVLLTFVSAGKLSAACVALFWYFAAAVWMGVFAMVYVWTFL